jgi:translocation and assembly module TamB
MANPFMKSFGKKALRGLKHLFVAVHAVLLGVILLACALFYIAFRPDGLEILREVVLQPLGIEVQDSNGSLLNGFDLQGVHNEKIDIKTLSLDYNLTAIVKGNHIIDSIHVDGLQIHLDDFINGGDGGSFALPIFTLKEVILTNIKLMSVYPIELDVHGKNGSFDGKNLNFKTLIVSARTQYASGVLSGVLKNNSVSGEGIVYPNPKELDQYVADFVTLPVVHPVKIVELSDSRVRLVTQFKTLQANFDPAMSLNAGTVKMDYEFANNYLDFTALHTLVREGDAVAMSQRLRYTFDGVTTTSFEGKFLSSSLPLPCTSVSGDFRDDKEGLAGKIVLDKTSLLLQSSDYQEYRWHATALQPSLEFLPFLPQALRSSPLEATAHGKYHLDSNVLDGEIRLRHNHVDLNGTLGVVDGAVKLRGALTLLGDAPTWKEWSMKPPSLLDFSIIHDANNTKAQVSGSDVSFYATVFDDRIQGAGNYLGTFFDINGSTAQEQTHIAISSVTPSLHKTLTLIPFIELPKQGYYDAEIRSTTYITYDTRLHVSTDVTIPWYAVVLDTRRQYSGTDNSFSLVYDDNKIFIDKYLFDIADHKITSSRPSYLHLDPQGKLIVDDVWIFDALHLTGEVDTNTFSSVLKLTSDKFTYKGPEGDAHVALNLQFDRDVNASQKLSGSITFLDGKITYLPLQQFKVMDDDVIIVQDVVPPSQSSLALEVKVSALQPLHYLTKELDVTFVPDVTLWKDPQNDMQMLGMVSMPKGTISTSGKKFVLRPSYVYFGGAVPINPYLDITVDHEVDYKKIQIYITHRLDSPIFLFSSDPVMNQNDIMSYILFGAAADTALSSGSGSDVSARADATNFMLGAGLKGLIGGATKLQIDTMNILTNKEGGMGFEVGARLNKDLRVLYKNDTISSVLVQYTVNRWLRLDADIHELGQGINAIYIKDFSDILPHNKAKPKSAP